MSDGSNGILQKKFSSFLEIFSFLNRRSECIKSGSELKVRFQGAV